MTYRLSIKISGEGKHSSYRSHWGFGDLLHVLILDLNRLWYQFEHRSGSNIPTNTQVVGICKIADLDSIQRRKAIEVIEAETAPRDGKRRCQDWVCAALVSLEVEELVPAGTAEVWLGLVGRSEKEVERAVEEDWEGLRG